MELNISGLHEAENNALFTFIDFRLVGVTEVSKEIESKYFISREVLESNVKLPTLEHQKISQSMIPAESLHQAIRVVQENGILTDLPNELPFPVSYARVRRVKHSEGKSYYFTIKGPKNAHCERAEVEVRVSKKIYRQLIPLATDGTVKKTRYILNSSFSTDDGRRVRLKKGVEIDILTHVGRGRAFKKLTLEQVDFALVDVEFRSKSERRSFNSEKHRLNFLINSGIEILPDGPRELRCLTMRYIAKFGFDRRLQSAINSLYSMYKKDRLRLKVAA